MKTRITVLLLLLISITMFGQYRKELGNKFDYDAKKELDLKVVLVDNYNHYTVSVTNLDAAGMSSNKVIIRKFDQKDQLVETFTQDFPSKDISTLHNYLGSFELGTDKVVVFADCYSGKTKKKEISKIIFDKKTGTFTTSVLAEFTFESLSKSGTSFAMSSFNKNFIGIVYSKFSNKKIAEEHQCIVLDGKTTDVIWQKTVTFPLLSFTDKIVLNDTGKFTFVMTTKETGTKNVLAIVDSENIENKDFGSEDIKILKPITFLAGPTEYLIAFDSYAHGVNISGFYGKILVYDLTAGKVLKNNFIKNFDQIKDLSKINFNNLFVQNDEIHLFTDCDFKSGTKPDPTFPNSTFTVPVYSNGYPSLFVFSMDGVLKNSVDYKVIAFPEGVKKCIGVLNIQGTYYVNAYVKIGSSFDYGVYKLNSEDYTLKNQLCKFSFNGSALELQPYLEGTTVPQLFNYLPDAKRMILAKSTEKDEKIFFFNVLETQL